MILSKLVPCSNRSECKNGFPLQIYLSGDLEQSTKTLDIEFNPEQIRQIIRKVDWDVLVKCASQFGMSLPLSYSEEDLDDDIFLCAVHDAVLKVRFFSS
ncbi:hypothetical protein OJ253_1599 [Cryptosporidium canis]|uniref:Uncharacterized protein n=1 Tax=Cryptosporidium canis TaxID=195482 RepID=A0A9D5HXL3_9CRYT|nr:hypothetical protein OJ253_1599 [Cryptosporidium canis]